MVTEHRGNLNSEGLRRAAIGASEPRDYKLGAATARDPGSSPQPAGQDARRRAAAQYDTQYVTGIMMHVLVSTRPSRDRRRP
jgi:hypothetical protein